jgi:hypothetical protein
MNTEKVTRTIFKLTSDVTIPDAAEQLKDGTFIINSDAAPLEQMAESELIEILKENILSDTNKFSGGPEVIFNQELKCISPYDGLTGKGSELHSEKMGSWKCQRCDHIMYIPPENGKLVEPFECENDVCGRKGAFKPLFPKELIKPIWKLPFDAVECTPTQLYEEIYSFVKDYLILKPDEYHIYTLWIMASWLIDDWDTCPYLLFIAPKESGKSQAIILLEHLCYRAVLSISVTPAALFRSIELWKITLLIDEAENQVRMDTESGQALYGCLNGGYKRNSYAIRVEGDNHIPTTYDVFGFKGLASTRIFHPTLESRSIIINMTQGKPKKLIIDKKDANLLRSKLLYWRFSMLGKLPIVMPESRSGRLIEMFIPLFTVAQIFKDKSGVKTIISHNDLKKILQNKITELENLRQEEEKDSTEAQIIQAIQLLEERCKEGYTDERTNISIKEIAEYLKDEKGWIEEIGKDKTTTIIGRKLKIMGLRTKHTMHGNVLDLNDETTSATLNELKNRFVQK